MKTQPPWFFEEDFSDVDGLRECLNNGYQSDRLVFFIRKQLSRRTIRALTPPLHADFAKFLVADFNRIVNSASHFDPVVFDSAKLSEATRVLLYKTPRGDGLHALKKRLLAEVFPSFINYSELQKRLDCYWLDQTGEPFGELLKELNPLILRHLYFCGCKTLQDAEDVRQAVLTGLARYFPKFRGRSERQLKALTYRITHRRYVDWKRRVISRREELTPPEEINIQLDKTTWDESLPAAIKLDMEVARRLLDRLTEKERLITILRFQDDATFKEIAEILEIKAGDAKITAYRAWKKLAQMLKGEK